MNKYKLAQLVGFTVNELKKVGFKWSKIGIRYLNYMKKI